MSECKHYKICGLDSLSNDEYCILHSHNPNKNKDDFERTLKNHIRTKPNLSDQIGSKENKITIDHGNLSYFVFNIPVNFHDLFKIKDNTLNRELNFKGVTFLEEVNFSNTTFEKIINFQNSKFKKKVNFNNSKFIMNCNFEESRFEDEVDFSDCMFENIAKFDQSKFEENSTFKNSKFKKETSFRKIEFTNNNYGISCDFSETKFHDSVNFSFTKFDAVSFDEATFMQSHNFSNTKFAQNVRFYRSIFESETNFFNTNFNQGANFSEARIVVSLNLMGVTSNGDIKFYNSKIQNIFIKDSSFSQNVSFEIIEFVGNFIVTGKKTSFSGDLIFNGVKFIKTCQFINVEFNKVDFIYTEFQDKVIFKNDIFGKELDLSNQNFSKEVSFDGSEFQEKVDFHKTIFNGISNFNNVMFIKEVDFSDSKFKNKVNFLPPVILDAPIANFYDKVDFSNVIFSDDVDFSHSGFMGEAKFLESTFEKRLNFSECQLKGLGRFEKSLFKDKVDFEFTIFEDRVNFSESVFEKEVSFMIFLKDWNNNPIKDSFSFYNSVDFTKTVFKEKMDFSNSRFKEDITFKESKFEKEVDFSGLEFNNINFIRTKFEDRVIFKNNIFGKELDLSNQNFPKDVSFDGSEFKEKTTFHKTSFNDISDFNNVIFRKEVDFSDSKFKNKVSFLPQVILGSTIENFYDKADFSNAIFSDDVDFSHSKFMGEANFSETVFEKKVSFMVLLKDLNNNSIKDSFNFYSSVDFTKTIFKEKIDFSNSRFKEYINFTETKFEKEVDFSGLEFNNVNFIRTKFENGTNFTDCTFNSDTDFSYSVFKGSASYFINTKTKDIKDEDIEKDGIKLSFKYSQFLNRVIFSNTDDREKAFSKFREIDFSDLILEPLKSLVFINVDLTRVSFINTDLREAEFTNVEWNLNDKNNSFIIYDERKSEDKNYNKLEKLYRDLKINFENRKDFNSAGEFHILEKEMRLNNTKIDCINKFILYAYKRFSEYGERVFLPLLWLVTILVLSAFGYIYTGSTYTTTDKKESILVVKNKDLKIRQEVNIKEEINLTPKNDKYILSSDKSNSNIKRIDNIPIKIDFENTKENKSNEKQKLSLCNITDWLMAFHYSIKVSIFMKPDFIKLTPLGDFIQTLETIIAPFFFALVALAIRQRLKRF